MKSKFSYKSKRTIIIATIITVLLVGTAMGVYFFTKGNAQSQAAGNNNTSQEQYGEAPKENNNEQQPNNTAEGEKNQNEQGETTPSQRDDQIEGEQEQEQETNNNQGTQNEQTTTTTTTGDVPNQEYVTEREETVKNPWESLEVGWKPAQIKSITSTANLTTIKSNLEIYKNVDKESVKSGDTLTYTISVKNNGDKVAKAIIYDNVPEGTVLLNKDNNEDENTKRLTWKITVEPGKTAEVEFTVRVKAENGIIKNSAVVNGKTTNETETKIKHHYTIEHYIENIDGRTYTKVEEDTTIINDVLEGTEASYTPNKYVGFIFDDSKTENKGEKVPDNNNLVIKLYYTRNSYKVIYKYKGIVPAGASELPVEVTYKYGADVKVAEDATAPGYTFNGWDKEDFTMPANDVEINGSFTANTDTKYTVEYYYQINGKYNDTTAITEMRTGTTGENVSVTENDKIPATVPGRTYVFDKEYSKNILSGNIAGDGSLILKLYFKQQFTVTYTDGVENENVFEDNVTSGLEYNDNTPEFGNDPVRTGYEFIGWVPEVKEKVTADATYVAQWKAQKYQYTVNYYYNGQIDSSVGINGEAEYGSEVGYTDKSNGFIFERVEPTSGKITICENVANNIINVYYIKEVLSVEKEATNNSVNAGDNIEYTITVRNNGLKEATTTVTDILPTEIDLSEEGIKIIKNSITLGGNYSEGKIIWNSVKIDAGTLDEKGKIVPAELKLTFIAKLNGNTIGKTVVNTVKLPEDVGEEMDITDTAEKTVNEKTIKVIEMTEGKKNTTDSNIVIVMDISSSMNWSIENNNKKTAELSKRRLTAAKNATKTFIQNFYAEGQNKNSTVSVILFNNSAWSLEFNKNNTTATSQNYEELLKAISKINIGDKPSGYGTNMKAALDATDTKIFGENGLTTTYKNNNNVVIFLSDGEPSDKDYAGANNKATPIKTKGATLYTIGFGPVYATIPDPIVGDSAYGLLKNMSSNGNVYQASDTDTLIKQFTDILAEENQSRTLTTGIFESEKISNGTLKIQMSKELVINEENKLVIKHNKEVIIECDNEADLMKYCITYDSTEKTLTWNVNQYLTSNSNGIIELKGNVEFVYYIPRNS